jgi:rhamnulokinase
VEVARAIVSDRALELNVTNEGGIDGTYRLLKNVMGLWLVQECRRSFERAGRPIDYAEMARQATAAAGFRAFINPDDPRFLAPDDMPTAVRQWCEASGQPVPQTEGELLRCVLESLALKYRVILDGLEELTGTPIEVIHVVGGGSQNELLNQLTADACGRPVIAGPVEATALGNVLVQARAAGAIGSLSDIRQVVRASSELRHYVPQRATEWQSARERFRELLARPTP